MAIQAMITILKNNDRMMHKRTKFKKTFGGYGKNRKTEYDLPKATPKQLRDIRQKFKEENPPPEAPAGAPKPDRFIIKKGG